MNMRSKIKKGCRLAMGLTVVFGLMACQNTPFSYTDKQAGPRSRVGLETSAQHSATWHGEDLTIDYTTVFSAGKFQISGAVQLDRYLVMGYMYLKYLYIHMHFLDADGKIIESHPVFNAGYRSPRRDIAFTKTVTLPPAAAGLAFSYSGFAREYDGDPGERNMLNSGWAFWQTPQR